jgi:hypothetical protein
MLFELRQGLQPIARFKATIHLEAGNVDDLLITERMAANRPRSAH